MLIFEILEIFLSLSAEHQEWYYYNTVSGRSQWEHPVDTWCRNTLASHRNNTSGEEKWLSPEIFLL